MLYFHQMEDGHIGDLGAVVRQLVLVLILRVHERVPILHLKIMVPTAKALQ